MTSSRYLETCFMLTNTQRKAHLPVWPTPFCRVNESPSCIPDLWERDHTFKFLCAMSNLSMLKKKGPKGIMILKLSPTILKIYLIKITDLQPQNGQKPRQVSCRATPLPCLPRCRPWRSPVLRRPPVFRVPLGAGELPPKLQIWKIRSLIHSNMYPSMLLGQ